MFGLPQTADIEYLAYARGERRADWPPSKAWYMNFVGFVTFKDSCWIGFRDRKIPGLFHVPLYLGYHEEQIEAEVQEYNNRHTRRTKRAKHTFDQYLVEEDLCKEFPWVLMFYGNDNGSFFARFGTKEEIPEWLNNWVIGDDFERVRRELFFYNS